MVRTHRTFAFLALLLALALPRVGAAADLRARADRLHRSAIVIDTHEDVPWALYEKWADLATPGATSQVDLPRLRKGGLTAAFFAIYVPPETGDRSAKTALELVDVVDRTIAAHPDVLVAATTAREIRAAKRAGKIAVLTGIEGGYAIEDSLARLRVFARLGVRYMTLTHTAPTAWADSSGPFWEPDYDPGKAAPHGGLTDFGRRVVREMNRLGVAVDVSHVSDDVVAQALETSRAPVFASHSSCRALDDMPRNLTDDQIRAIAAKGGVVMITIGSAFVDAASYQALRRFAVGIGPQVEALRAKYAGDPKRLHDEVHALWKPYQPVRAPWTRIVDHLEHALKIAPGAVGIGTDLDGVDDLPEGFDDAAALPRITEELLRRGHSEAEIRGVLGESFLRFLERVEATAVALRGEPPDTGPGPGAR